MILESIHASILEIPFKTTFKHASAERKTTQTIWMTAHARSGARGFGEGCPREYVSAESLASAEAFIGQYSNDWLRTIDSIDTLKDWVARHGGEIDANPAAWTAVELALLDLLGKEAGCSVEKLLGLPELAGRFSYTAVLGDAEPRQFEAQLAQYLGVGFHNFKIKLSGEYERDLAKVRALTAAGILPQAVRADANNLWADAHTAIAYFEALNFKFFALEEPLRANDIDGMRQIADALGANIILDESLLRTEQLARLVASPACWIVNVRVSKMGGLLRSLALVREAHARKLRLIVGAHVGETSLLTRAGLTVANCARDILLAQEGAFGTHLLTRDIVEKSLMFAGGGVLDIDAYGVANKPGFGLAILSA